MRRYAALAIVTAAMIGLVGVRVSLAKGEKLTVTSKKQSIDYANRILTYQGEVEANWENYTIKADKVEVYLTSRETLEKIIASGRVKITQQAGIQATCQEATYLPLQEVLTLEGEVEYQDESGNNLQAQKVTVWIQDKKLQAEGNPVKATYILKEEKKEEESGASGGKSK